MHGKWVAVLALTAMLAGCGTAASARPAAPPAAAGATPRTAVAQATAPAGSRAAEYLHAASFRSVTVSAAEVFPRPRTVTRTFTSAAVIGALVALINRLPAAPSPDVAAMKCLAIATVYRLAFTPGVVVDAGECGGTDAITVGGHEQPRLADPGVLTAAARQLLGLLHLTP